MLRSTHSQMTIELIRIHFLSSRLSLLKRIGQATRLIDCISFTVEVNGRATV